MLLYMWLTDHYLSLKLERFDYIIIDCHPDFSIATRNALAVSHSIISPLTPSEHGYNAKYNIEQRLDAFRDEVIDYQTRKSYITAQLYFIANMIAPNKNSSRNLLEKLSTEEKMIGVIPDKELFNRSTLEKISVPEMRENLKHLSLHRKFYEELEKTFSYISDII